MSLSIHINISADNEFAFRWACKNGHIQVAQWLLQVKPDINISADDEYAFRAACYNGHLQVAQWLLQVNPNINISANNEFAFRRACNNGHLQVAQWLHSLHPQKYQYTIDNQTNKITPIISFSFSLETTRHLPASDIQDCPICYESLSNVITRCGHMCCKPCITKYISSQTGGGSELQCFMCRTSYNKNNANAFFSHLIKQT